MDVESLHHEYPDSNDVNEQANDVESAHRSSQTEVEATQPSGTVDGAIRTTEIEENMTLEAKIAQYKSQLDDEFKLFEASLDQEPQDSEFEVMDWKELENRYNEEMATNVAEEKDLTKEFSDRFKQFMLWMQVSNDREAERALKRLRTRMAFVQQSEDQLIEKQLHHDKVLSAFNQAMALLNNL